MNSKILIAFIAGALIASGIVYMAVKDEALPRAPVVSADIPRPSPPSARPAVAVRAPTAPAQSLSLSRTPVREKPSPMPPPVRRERPVTVARYRNPLPQPEAPARTSLPPVEAKIPDEPPQPPPAPVPVSPRPISPQSPSPQPPSPQPPSPQPQARSEDVPPTQPASEANLAPTVTIAAGMLLTVRVGETISAAHYQVGDRFLATLDRPLVVDGWVIAEKGSRLEGRVVQSTPPDRGNSGSHLEVELVKLSLADGQHIQIRTETYKKEGTSSTGNDVAKIATGTVLGTAIGAAAGGGKGAAIGAGIGTVAGVAGAAITHGKPAEIPVESRISFRIAGPVTITERLGNVSIGRR
jgi:hypothetical protein